MCANNVTWFHSFPCSKIFLYACDLYDARAVFLLTGLHILTLVPAKSLEELLQLTDLF